ncbi:MAG: OmpH family outer membrane protein [Desulfobacteraceae bacterium]|jgi:outer membrane protein|nr:OmpH family outer membrane protein [Desulfobacteraceae bacterium]
MRLGKYGFIVVVLVVFFVLPVYAADVAKIGIIDFQRVLTESEAGKAVQGQIQIKGREMETNLIELGKEIEGLTEQIRLDSMVMSKEKREEQQRELEIKKYDFQSMQKKYQMEFRELEGIEVEKLKNDIFDLAEKIGKKEGYLLIIEKSAAIYYPSTIDMTDELIEKYNSTTKSSE